MQWLCSKPWKNIGHKIIIVCSRSIIKKIFRDRPGTKSISLIKILEQPTACLLALSVAGWPQILKTMGIWKIVKISGKTQDKWKVCDNCRWNCIPGNFISRAAQGKVWKYPGNHRDNSENLVSQKCGHPVFTKFYVVLSLCCWAAARFTIEPIFIPSDDVITFSALDLFKRL